MSYSIHSFWTATEIRAGRDESCPRSGRYPIHTVSSRGRLRRAGASVGPMVRSLLRKKEVRRLGMGRRWPHRIPVHQDNGPQADPT